jgi:geranylgeranyl pyrophosphate synthase
LGALSTNASAAQLSALTEFGNHLGLAFQIIDDLLDVTASAEQMGKATGKDAAKGKNTYPALLGVDETRRQAKAQLAEAIKSLGALGPSADGLRSLAAFVVERQV